MIHQTSASRGGILGLQWLLVTGGLAMAAITPPARGAMVAIPLFASARADGIAGMIAAGARIERQGPVAGSLVLFANRNAILPAALSHGFLLLPTGLTGCTTTDDTA